jgi:CSLREA domain-containing protein
MRRFVLLSILAALGPAAAGAAPTFVVNSLVDAPAGANVADGVCETGPGNGVCTLRAAVMEANAVAGGGATIRLPAGVYFLTLRPTENGAVDGDLDLEASLTILGAGPSATIVDGNRLDRVFANRADPVILRGLTIRNGATPVDKPFGGGISNLGNLSLENVVVAGSESLAGGGIFSNNTLALRDCIIEGNVATQSSGGGIAAGGGSTQVRDSMIRGNDAAAWGGGIAGGGQMRVERTLISGNYAEKEGGGVAIFQDALVVLNSTISENDASMGGGGMIALKGSSVQVIHATLTANRQTLVAPSLRGGLAVEPGATLLLKNSVVAGNLALQGDVVQDYVASECGSLETPVLSGDYNLIGDRASCFLTGALAHVNPSNADPQLLPLAPNGGFAPDQAGTGPTLGKIPAQSCTDELGSPLREDQRGYARVGACDIGAHEGGSFYTPEALLGVELVRNGGAEGNELGRATDGSGVEAPPYWRSGALGLTQIVYGAPGDYPLASEAPTGSGSQFLGGGGSAVASAFQEIDVSALAAQIDAGEIAFTVSGAFGGYLTDDDSAALNVGFEDGSATLDTVTLGGFTAADRGNLTRLLPDSAQGTVPPGTRHVLLTLEATRTNSTSNDGYADDISLVLVPEPPVEALGGLTLAALLSLRARRIRSVPR